MTVLTQEVLNVIGKSVNDLAAQIDNDRLFELKIGELREKLLAIPNLERAIYAYRDRPDGIDFYRQDMFAFSIPELAIAHAYIDTNPDLRDEFVKNPNGPDLTYFVYSDFQGAKCYAVRLFELTDKPDHAEDINIGNAAAAMSTFAMSTFDEVKYIFKKSDIFQSETYH